METDNIIIDGLQYCRWDRNYFIELQQSGINAVHVTLVYHENTRETLSLFALWDRLFAENIDIIMPVMSTEDILLAKSKGKVGIFFGAQNCSPIENEIGLVSVMRRQGLLIMQLTYNNQSLLATGCYEKNDTGITRFGMQVIDEMNRVGMIIDMSHSSEISTLEAIEISKRPICISHANPSFCHPGKRNKSNEIIKALAKSGGILGFSLYPFHLPNGSQCTIEEFCKMIADSADIIGVEHLGIGSDLVSNQPLEVLYWMRNGKWSKTTDYGEGSKNQSGWPEPVSWFQDSSGFSNIQIALDKYGFSEKEIHLILGENWYNFLRNELEPSVSFN